MKILSTVFALMLATSAVLGVTLTACAKILDWYLK